MLVTKNAGIRWGVVATVSEPLPLLMAFTAHHIAAGADQVTLYLDDPDPKVSITLETSPKCRVIQCDTAYWSSHSKNGRPTDHRLRQTFNANDALNHADVHWLIHMDADEFLTSTIDIAEELSHLEPDIEAARVQNQERVYQRGVVGSDIFVGLARGPIRSRLVNFVFYRQITKFMNRGMIGYSGGKCFLRVGCDNRMGIHRPEKPTKTAALGSTGLLHFDGLTREHWLEKLYAKAITSSEIPAHKRNPARRNIINFAKGPGLDRKKMEWLFSATMEISLLKAKLMRLFGLMKSNRLNIQENIAEVYPGQIVDLSPESFDRIMLEKTRAVLYRGAIFHVNLLQNNIERLIGLKGETHDEKELDWLIANLKGKTICFFDIGANIGLYTVTIASQLSSESTVVAVENNPTLLARLYRNLDSNDLDKVHVCESVISDFVGMTTLNTNNTETLHDVPFGKSKYGSKRELAETPAITLLECMDHHDVPRIDFLKIDIERYESNVLNYFYANAASERFPRLVLLKMKHTSKQVTELHNRMIAAGYHTCFQTNNNCIYSLRDTAI